MRVLITGATGYLGSQLATYLVARGFELVLLGRNPKLCKELQNKGFNVFTADLSRPLNPDLLDSIGSIDAIVHCAALSAPWGPLKTFTASNVIGTQNTIELAHKLKAKRFVNISSPTVYFEWKDKIAVRETSPLPAPINAYAKTKAEAEKLVLNQQALGPINLRPRGIYGAGEQTLVPRLLTAARKMPLPVFRDGIAEIDLTHVSDVVSAIEAALVAPSEVQGHTFNISSGEVMPVRQIVDQVCTAYNVEVNWRKVPLSVAAIAARTAEFYNLLSQSKNEPSVTRYSLGLFAFRQSLNIEKATTMFDWKPKVKFSEGLSLTLGSNQ